VRAAEGFTLVELVVTMAIAMTVMGICIAWVPPMAEGLQADSDMHALRHAIDVARERATNQRRAVEIRFVPPNVVQTIRTDLPVGNTLLSSVTLEHNARFLRFAGLPDTPDGFGGGQDVNIGAAAPVFFSADGMLVDNAGNPVNATIFIGQQTRPLTARAVTIFGLTARVRSYRWNGSTWRQ
jgi:Tfp pilus assembly protein FimT